MTKNTQEIEFTKDRLAKLLNTSKPTLNSWINSKYITFPATLETLILDLATMIRNRNSSDFDLKEKLLETKIKKEEFILEKTQDKFIKVEDFDTIMTNLSINFLKMTKETSEKISNIAKTNAPKESADIISSKTEQTLKKFTNDISELFNENN